MDERVQKWFDGLPEGERAAFLAHLDKVQELLHRLAVADGSVFSHQLDLTLPEPVRRLKEEAAFEGGVNSNITDANFPVSGEGVRDVKFRLLSGDELKRADGWVYRSDVEAVFAREGMHCADSAEGILPFAKDRKLGRGDHPVVVFIKGSQDAFIVNEDGRKRYLGLYGLDSWRPNYEFLGVCE